MFNEVKKNMLVMSKKIKKKPIQINKKIFLKNSWKTESKSTISKWKKINKFAY